MNKKLVRITTVPLSLDKLLSGQLHFMKNEYQVIAISSDQETLTEFGKKEQVTTFFVNLTRKITPFQDLAAIIKLYLYLKKEKPFIVHTHTPKAGMVGMIASKLANVPNRLHTVAGLPLLEAIGVKRKILDLVEKITYSCATKVYPNAFGLLEIIKKNNYCKTTKLKVLANGSSNGINTSHFDTKLFSEAQKLELKKKLEIEENDFVYIFVGRMVKDKGIQELVTAFTQLSTTFSNIKLLLVGPFESELDPLNTGTVFEIVHHKNIRFVGFQNDVRPYFAISNVLVFPSYREGFPNVVMQAGAMNLPCIVSNINGCNEIITENENGFIIPVKNYEAIKNAMQKFLENKDLQLEMATNARKKIVTNYEQNVVWNAILNEYKALENV